MPALSNPIGVENDRAYVITGPDGTRAVLNDTTDSDFVGYVAPRSGGGIAGLERSNVREVSDLLPEADGGVHGKFLRDRLTFTISGLILPESTAGDSWVGRQARLLRATDALDADATLSWTPSEAMPVFVKFRSQQATRITEARPKRFLIAGVSAEPAVFSQALQFSQLIPSLAGTGGLASPMVSPLTSGATTVGGLTVTHEGSTITWPEITFVGPCSNPSVVHGSTGLGLYFNTTLAAGETLVVDTNPRRRSVKLNGTGNRFGALDYSRSAWFALKPGTNTLQLGFSSYGSPAALEVRWRHAWG